jgi:hypothetical protein
VRARVLKRRKGRIAEREELWEEEKIEQRDKGEYKENK